MNIFRYGNGRWFILGVLFAFILVGCSGGDADIGPLPESPLLRMLERKSGRIAFIGVDGNVYTMDQGGGNQAAITTDADFSREGETSLLYQFPTWSLDGRLGFVSFLREGSSIQSGVHVTDLNREQVDRVFQSQEEIPFFLYWSPDNERLSFLTSQRATGVALLRMATLTDGTAEVVGFGQSYYWAWSPDGSSMLSHVDGAAEQNINAHVAQLNFEADVREERFSLEPHQFRAPSWAPDGSRALIAEISSRGGGNLVLTDRRGMVTRELASYEGEIAFSWSPDGKYVAYLTGEPGELGTFGKLTIIDSMTGEVVQKAQDDHVLTFFWAPDSKQMVYFLGGTISAEGDGSGLDQIPNDYVVIIKLLKIGKEAAQQVGVFPPTPQFLSILPVFDQFHLAGTLWSPDSENLVVSAFNQDGTPGIWVLPITDNLPPRFLVPGTLGVWSWE